MKSVILAENFAGLGLLYLVICFSPVVVAIFGFKFAKRWPILFLTFGMISTLMAGLNLMMLFKQSGELNPAVWVVAFSSLLAGLACIIQSLSSRTGA